MNRIVRSVSLFLALGMLLALPVYAEESSSRASLFFAAYTVCIDVIDEDSFQAYFNVTGKRTMQELGATEMVIQESDNGVAWSSVRTLTTEYYPQMVCENTVGHAWWFGWTATAGKCYRIKVTLWAKDSTGSGEKTVYSDPVWF